MTYVLACILKPGIIATAPTYNGLGGRDPLELSTMVDSSRENEESSDETATGSQGQFQWNF